VGPEQLRIANLLTRLSGEVDEVILATSPTTEGEATAVYLSAEIRKGKSAVRITRIATGVPAGSDIEYADEVTMMRAMEGRREF
jgi:recombination protein RecR